MAEPAEQQADKIGDPIGTASENTNTAKPLAADEDDDMTEIQPTTTLQNIVKRPALEQSKSYATSASALSGVTESTTQAEKASWYRKLNPLRWGTPPPPPQERTNSREYGAGFWSMMTFQWMAPIMTVSYLLFATPL